MAEDGWRAVADKQEITEQLYRYCRAVDRIDHQLGYAVWHADGTADYGPRVFQGSGRGFIDYVCRQHSQLLAHSHQVSNVLIQLDGVRAGSEAYVTATLRLRRGDAVVQMMVWSRYIDRWSRREGRWAIDHRITVMDMDELRDVMPMQQHERARRDHTDESYAALPPSGE